MNDLDEVLLHYGVKGMKWGVIRDRNRPGGADGRPDKSDRKRQNGNKVTTRVKETVGSIKRERQWKKVMNEVNTMSTKQINTVARRLQMENDLKRLSSKSNVGSSKDKQDYRRRANMSDQELTRKVNRLRAKDNLARNVDEATRGQREMGQRIVKTATSVGVKYALTGSVDAGDIFNAVTNPKQASNKAKEDLQKYIQKAAKPKD